MKKILFLLYLFIFPINAFSSQLFFVEKFKTDNNRDYNFFGHGIKAYLEAYIQQFKSYSRIPDSKYQAYKKINKIDVLFSGACSFSKDNVTVKLIITQTGDTKITVTEKITDINKLITNLIKQIKIYLAVEELPDFGFEISYNSFRLHSLSLIYLENKPDIALRHFIPALAQSPFSLVLLNDLVELYIKINNRTEAVKATNNFYNIAKKSKSKFYENISAYFFAETELVNTNYKNAYEINENVWRYFEANGNVLLAFKSILLSVKIKRLTHDLETAEKYIKYAGKIIENEIVNAFANVEYGAIYYYRRNPLQAIEKFKEALKTFETHNFTALSANTNSNLSSAYILSGGYEEAEKLLQTVLKSAKTLKSDNLYYIFYFNTGEIEFRKKNYSKALDNYNLSLQYAGKNGDILPVLKSRYMIGRMYLRNKKFKEALEQFFLVVSVSRKLLLDRLHGWSLYYIHLSYLNLKDKEKSLAYLRLCTDILGYSKDPAIDKLRKRLQLLEKGEQTEELNDDPLVIKEQETPDASRRQRAVTEAQTDGRRPAGERQPQTGTPETRRQQEQTPPEQRQPVVPTGQQRSQSGQQNPQTTPIKK